MAQHSSANAIDSAAFETMQDFHVRYDGFFIVAPNVNRSAGTGCLEVLSSLEIVPMMLLHNLNRRSLSELDLERIEIRLLTSRLSNLFLRPTDHSMRTTTHTGVEYSIKRDRRINLNVSVLFGSPA